MCPNCEGHFRVIWPDPLPTHYDCCSKIRIKCPDCGEVTELYDYLIDKILQRDPKRTWTKAERQQRLDQQNGKCRQCGKDKTVDQTHGHHRKRHADGGRTNGANHDELCHDCHKKLHKP